jgi:hypothetical protein
MYTKRIFVEPVKGMPVTAIIRAHRNVKLSCLRLEGKWEIGSIALLILDLGTGRGEYSAVCHL